MEMRHSALAFLNEPVSLISGCLVLNGGNIKWCTLRGQEEMKDALVTSKVHLHCHLHCMCTTFESKVVTLTSESQDALFSYPCGASDTCMPHVSVTDLQLGVCQAAALLPCGHCFCTCSGSWVSSDQATFSKNIKRIPDCSPCKRFNSSLARLAPLLQS